MTEIFGINGKPVQVDPAVFAGLHPDDQKRLQTPPAPETSIHVLYGETYVLDENNDTLDRKYGTVRLVGFQNDIDIQRVNLFVDDWRKAPESAIGKFPVFSRGAEGIFVNTRRVTVVRYEGKRIA